MSVFSVIKIGSIFFTFHRVFSEQSINPKIPLGYFFTASVIQNFLGNKAIEYLGLLTIIRD